MYHLPRFLSGLLLLALLLSSCGAKPAQPIDSSAAPQPAAAATTTMTPDEIHRAWITALSSKDREAALALYDPLAVMRGDRIQGMIQYYPDLKEGEQETIQPVIQDGAQYLGYTQVLIPPPSNGKLFWQSYCRRTTLAMVDGAMVVVDWKEHMTCPLELLSEDERRMAVESTATAIARETAMVVRITEVVAARQQWDATATARAIPTPTPDYQANADAAHAQWIDYMQTNQDTAAAFMFDSANGEAYGMAREIQALIASPPATKQGDAHGRFLRVDVLPAVGTSNTEKTALSVWVFEPAFGSQNTVALQCWKTLLRLDAFDAWVVGAFTQQEQCPRAVWESYNYDPTR
jgi:hypothetical protein